MHSCWKVSLPVIAALFPAYVAAAETYDYSDCIAKAVRTPVAAIAWAQRWEFDADGGDAARHCRAVALSELDKFMDAALLLQELAGTQAADAAVRAAHFWAQAGQAWLRHGDLAAAEAAATNARQLAPDIGEFAVDLAQIYVERQAFDAARETLVQAIELDPENDDAYAFHAGLLRRDGAAAAALHAAETALTLNPDNPSASLERGLALLALQKTDQARAAFLDTAEKFAGTPAGDAAQANLEKLDLKQ